MVPRTAVIPLSLANVQYATTCYISDSEAMTRMCRATDPWDTVGFGEGSCTAGELVQFIASELAPMTHVDMTRCMVAVVTPSGRWELLDSQMLTWTICAVLGDKVDLAATTDNPFADLDASHALNQARAKDAREAAQILVQKSPGLALVKYSLYAVLPASKLTKLYLVAGKWFTRPEMRVTFGEFGSEWLCGDGNHVTKSFAAGHMFIISRWQMKPLATLQRVFASSSSLSEIATRLLDAINDTADDSKAGTSEDSYESRVECDSCELQE